MSDRALPGGALPAHPLRNEKLYPWAPYDPTASDADRIAWLEDRLEHERFEAQFHDRWMDRLAEAVHEIARNLPTPPEWLTPGHAWNDRKATLAGFWRWAMWEDCMADVPQQVERCLQALVAGAAFPS